MLFDCDQSLENSEPRSRKIFVICHACCHHHLSDRSICLTRARSSLSRVVLAHVKSDGDDEPTREISRVERKRGARCSIGAWLHALTCLACNKVSTFRQVRCTVRCKFQRRWRTSQQSELLVVSTASAHPLIEDFGHSPRLFIKK